MKSLRERLAQFDRPARSTPAVDHVADGEPLRALLDAGARWVGEPPGGHLRTEAGIEGLAPPGEAVGTRACRRLAAVEPRGAHWVVLDTETTGLESGTGTMVFLVGLLHWSPAGARRVQLFLPEPAGEHGLLSALLDELAPADLIVTYNGRSFDVPRLRTRLRLQRFDTDGLERPHLDLVHPARRILRTWLDGLRQADLEQHLLGLDRDDDLPGSHAPEVYRTLQADGRDAGLVGVVEHNARDVDRLARLATWFARCVGDDPPPELPGSARLAVARLLVHRGERDEAEAHLVRLADHPDRQVALSARRMLAHVLRRQQRFVDAAREWETIVASAPMDVDAHVEWAKLCEHRLGDLERAHEVVRRALRVDMDRRRLDPAATGVRADLIHRLQRIERRRRRGRGIDGVGAH